MLLTRQAAGLREVAAGVGPVLTCRRGLGAVHLRGIAASSSECVARRYGCSGEQEARHNGRSLRRDSKVRADCVCIFWFECCICCCYFVGAFIVRLTWANRSSYDEDFDLNLAMSSFDDDIAREAKEVCIARGLRAQSVRLVLHLAVSVVRSALRRRDGAGAASAKRRFHLLGARELHVIHNALYLRVWFAFCRRRAKARASEWPGQHHRVRRSPSCPKETRSASSAVRRGTMRGNAPP